VTTVAFSDRIIYLGTFPVLNFQVLGDGPVITEIFAVEFGVFRIVSIDADDIEIAVATGPARTNR
jgi:hypothetical protein